MYKKKVSQLNNITDSNVFLRYELGENRIAIFRGMRLFRSKRVLSDIFLHTKPQSFTFYHSFSMLLYFFYQRRALFMHSSQGITL